MRKHSSVFLFLCVVLLTGCSREERFGEEFKIDRPIKISEILKNGASFEDKMVRIEGRIIDVCPSGCWFILEENGVQIYVELAPAGFAIPKKVNKKASVEGKIVLKDNKPIIIASGVVIR